MTRGEGELLLQMAIIHTSLHKLVGLLPDQVGSLGVSWRCKPLPEVGVLDIAVGVSAIKALEVGWTVLLLLPSWRPLPVPVLGGSAVGAHLGRARGSPGRVPGSLPATSPSGVSVRLFVPG